MGIRDRAVRHDRRLPSRPTTADAIDRPDKGRIAVGAAADLIAVCGDPTGEPDAMASVARVWKAGRPIV
ncbi:MAG TPA: hypothetical protein VLA10_06420 [Ilumatobacter sp.]|nr:hypothetical protein [Ilumatobacter sp.]